jgi:hypothetical protein
VQISPIWTFIGKKLEAIAITIDERILFGNEGIIAWNERIID